MTDRQFLLCLLAIASVLVVTIAAWRKWLPRPGKFQFVLLFLAGALPIALMAAANVPPKWFDGGVFGFGLGVTMLASSFLGEERWFRLPFLSGFGVALIAVNAWSLIQP